MVPLGPQYLAHTNAGPYIVDSTLLPEAAAVNAVGPVSRALYDMLAQAVQQRNAVRQGVSPPSFTPAWSGTRPCLGIIIW